VSTLEEKNGKNKANTTKKSAEPQVMHAFEFAQ
jgi:hypothetical protein